MKKKIYNSPNITVVTVQLASIMAGSIGDTAGADGLSKGGDWSEGSANSRGGSWDDED